MLTPGLRPGLVDARPGRNAIWVTLKLIGDVPNRLTQILLPESGDYQMDMIRQYRVA